MELTKKILKSENNNGWKISNNICEELNHKPNKIQHKRVSVFLQTFGDMT